MENFINKKAEAKYQKRSSVSSLNRFIHYKKGLADGISIMKDWGRYYEENKYKMYVLNKKTEDELLEDYLNSR